MFATAHAMETIWVCAGLLLLFGNQRQLSFHFLCECECLGVPTRIIAALRAKETAAWHAKLK